MPAGSHFEHREAAPGSGVDDGHVLPLDQSVLRERPPEAAPAVGGQVEQAGDAARMDALQLLSQPIQRRSGGEEPVGGDGLGWQQGGEWREEMHSHPAPTGPS